MYRQCLSVRSGEFQLKQSRQVPSTIADYVLQELRTGILSGKYPVGSKLDQQALATELGASHIPIRESLRQLEAEGLVRILPRRGAFVSELSIAELREIYLIRQALEPIATRLAVPHLSPSTVQRLRGVIDRMSHLYEDQERWQQLNRQFHFAIYTDAQSPFLLQFIGLLWDRSSLFRNYYTRLETHRDHSQQAHTEILDACVGHDAEAAASAMTDHIQEASREFTKDGTSVDGPVIVAPTAFLRAD
jgi:DNA-binding GntR family transcriptional regulator